MCTISLLVGSSSAVGAWTSVPPAPTATPTAIDKPTGAARVVFVFVAAPTVLSDSDVACWSDARLPRRLGVGVESTGEP